MRSMPASISFSKRTSPRCRRRPWPMTRSPSSASAHASRPRLCAGSVDSTSARVMPNTLALSAKAWLRWKCNLDHDAASGQVDVARQLDSLPQTFKAFADGDISFTHVSLIANTAKQLGDRMEAEAEGVLVKLAAEVDPR